MWQQWVNVILGLWLIVMPFTGINGSTATWTLVVTGIIVAGLALWSGIQERSPEHHREALRHSHSH